MGTDRAHRAHRRGAPRVLAVLGAAALVVAACGTRMDHDELVALAGGTGGSAGDVVGPSAGEDGAAAPDAEDGGVADGVNGTATPGQAGAPGGANDGGGGGGGGGEDAAPADGGVDAAEQPNGTGAATGTPITIATVATISGVVGQFVKASVDAVSVWAEWINDRGGLNGHPVRHVVADDGGDSARYNALVQRLHQEEGAIAFLVNTVGFGAAGNMSYFEEHRIPLIGHEAGLEISYTSPMLFTPFAAAGEYAYGLAAALASRAVPQGATELASLACSDFFLCDTFDDAWSDSQAMGELGFTGTVYRARPSLTQADFTAECLSAKGRGATAIILGMDANSVSRLAAACARQGYHPQLGSADMLAIPALAEDPNVDGMIIGSKMVPWNATNIPGIANLHEAMAQYAPGVPVTGPSAGGWLSARVLQEAGANLPADPTSEDVLDGLWSIADNDMDGMTYPLTFTEGQGSPRRACWGTVIIEDGEYRPFNDGQLTCK